MSRDKESGKSENENRYKTSDLRGIENQYKAGSERETENWDKTSDLRGIENQYKAGSERETENRYKTSDLRGNMNRNIISEQSGMASNLRVFHRTMENEEGREYRVAAYCRVSTNLKVQESSLETQMASFRQRIAEHPGWTLVGIYADKGLTGTTARGRVEFQRLIKDAGEGKIDYIMAKSISRFARNTVDALSYTRKLKEMGVGVYFEEQNLDTLSVTSEIFLTIHAAFAQEESHSFSENMKRGVRNRFALGIPKWSETYGYRQNNGEWCINEEEAEVVREIYRLYVEGRSLPMICAEFESRGIKPPKGSKQTGGRDVWYAHSIANILHSEKYIGDVEMQKSYTVDCLTHKRVSNDNADIPKYYKKGHHKAIIDNETYMLAQTILALRDRHRGGVQYPFYSFLKCPFCGENMLKLRLPTRNFEPAWFCGGKCKLFAVKEKYIDPAVVEACEKTGNKAPSHNVEYKFLYDNVDSITFGKNGALIDWNSLVVRWKWGEVTEGEITYGTPSDIPCTGAEIIDGYVVINGEKTTKQRFAAVCVNRVIDFIRDTEIYDGEDVPIVITPNSRKGMKNKMQTYF